MFTQREFYHNFLIREVQPNQQAVLKKTQEAPGEIQDQIKEISRNKLKYCGNIYEYNSRLIESIREIDALIYKNNVSKQTKLPSQNTQHTVSPQILSSSALANLKKSQVENNLRVNADIALMKKKLEIPNFSIKEYLNPFKWFAKPTPASIMPIKPKHLVVDKKFSLTDDDLAFIFGSTNTNDVNNENNETQVFTSQEDEFDNELRVLDELDNETQVFTSQEDGFYRDSDNYEPMRDDFMRFCASDYDEKPLP